MQAPIEEVAMHRLIFALMLAVLPAVGSAATVSYFVSADFAEYEEPGFGPISMRDEGVVHIWKQAFIDRDDGTRYAAFSWNEPWIEPTANLDLFRTTLWSLGAGYEDPEPGIYAWSFWVVTDRDYNWLDFNGGMSDGRGYGINRDWTWHDADLIGLYGPAPRFERIAPIPIPPAAALLFGGIGLLMFARRRGLVA